MIRTLSLSILFFIAPLAAQSAGNRTADFTQLKHARQQSVTTPNTDEHTLQDALKSLSLMDLICVGAAVSFGILRDIPKDEAKGAITKIYTLLAVGWGASKISRYYAQQNQENFAPLITFKAEDSAKKLVK